MNTWQEERDEHHNADIRILSAHLFRHGVLLTLRWRIPGRPTDLINQEITFMASFEQAEDIANTILSHVRKHIDPPSDSPSQNDPIS